MVHVSLFIFLLSLCIGSAAIASSLVSYTYYKKDVLVHFAGILLCIVLILFARFVYVYGEISDVNFKFNESLIKSLKVAGYAAGIFFGPLFYESITGKKLVKRPALYFSVFSGVYLILGFLEIVFSGSDFSIFLHRYIASIPLFGTFIFIMIKSVSSFGQLGSSFLNILFVFSFITGILTFPFSFVQYLNQKPYFSHYLESAIAFFILMVFSLYCAVRYFNKPSLVKNGKPTEYFKRNYDLTKRETDIVLSLLKGKTNSEIADELFISKRTVETHLYKVFQKTAVKNRIQLINLLHLNKEK